MYSGKRLLDEFLRHESSQSRAVLSVRLKRLKPLGPPSLGADQDQYYLLITLKIHGKRKWQLGPTLVASQTLDPHYLLYDTRISGFDRIKIMDGWRVCSFSIL